MTSHTTRDLEALYMLYTWIEDLETEKGLDRYRRTVVFFKEKLFNHPWVKELTGSRKHVVVLDICGGCGVGGLALARALMDQGIDVDLIVNDLRKSPLEYARRYGEELLGKRIKTLYGDATKLYRERVKADIALLYGYSTPHFSPWDMVKLISSTARILEPNGLFIVEEADSVYTVFYKVGYKEFLAENIEEDKAVISIHAGYNVKTGMFKRLIIDLLSKNRMVAEIHFWNTAGVGALLWTFFQDIDYIPYNDLVRGLLIARNPRKVNPEEYQLEPTILKK